MADDAAAPDGELTTSRADSAGTTDKEASGAVEPDSTASDVPETGKPESAATAEAATATNADEDTEAEDTEAEGTEEADDAEGVVADEAAPARAPGRQATTSPSRPRAGSCRSPASRTAAR